MCDREYLIKNNSSLLDSLNKQNFKVNQKEDSDNCLPTFLIHSLDHIENEINESFDENEKENISNEKKQNNIKKENFDKNYNKKITDNNIKGFVKKKI